MAACRTRLLPTRNLHARSSSSLSTSNDMVPPPRPLKHLPNAALFRTLFLGRVLASPRLSRFGMHMLAKVASSRQPLLDPDRNWILSRVLRATIYNQFCAGAEPPKIRSTVAGIRSVGYAGVILNYAREVMAHDLANTDPVVDVSAQQIQHWLDGNLHTLNMIGRDDFLGLKYTGAGGRIASALTAGEQPPKQFEEALHAICHQARSQGTRILLDAEQQVYQPTIDRWTVDLMRQYNRDGDTVVLNTYQSYLKASRHVLRAHLELAQSEGWTLGIKLVRGAYILNDMRERIHDTKADTDAWYNGIAHDLLTRSFDGIEGPEFPRIRLFLAGHNLDSIQRATSLHQSLIRRGLKPDTLELGQLYGMADHVSGLLLRQVEQAHRCEGLPEEQAAQQRQAAPRVFKCVNWGTVRESLHFLMRRAAENQGAAERLQEGLAEAKSELKARFFKRDTG